MNKKNKKRSLKDNKKIKKEIKILYLYNIKNWAIHNVGRLWLEKLPNIKVSFKSDKEVKSEDFDNYDFVWFGYLDLYLEFMYNVDKSIISVHDPCEIFPQIKDWKSETAVFLSGLNNWIRTKRRMNFLRKLKNIVVTSNEMKKILEKNKIESYLIPTASLLPTINKKITTKKISVISVLWPYQRKNISLLLYLQKFCTNKKIKFDIKLNRILANKDYMALLDNHEVYICTSFQEGGPLTAMDAMKRGCMILTTPVGQIQEIIKNGENGFICKTKKDFINKINLLSNNLNLLNKMRIKSLESIKKMRSEKIIKDKVRSFLLNL